MSICPIDKGHCCCQPQEGIGCHAASPSQAIQLAYKAGKDIGASPAPVQVPEGYVVVSEAAVQMAVAWYKNLNATVAYYEVERAAYDELCNASAAAPSAPFAVASGCNRCGVAHHPKDCPAAPSAPAAHEAVAQGVDVEKVMAMVERLADALSARLGTNADEWAIVHAARALLTPAIANQEGE